MTILFFIRYVALLVFGIAISFAFAGIRFSKKTFCSEFSVFLLSTVLQLVFFVIFGDRIVWMLYPLLTHLPIALVFLIRYKKRLSTIFASISAAYLCCQPAKWTELFYIELFGKSDFADWLYIISLVLSFIIFIKTVTPYASKIYNKNDSLVYLFGVIPMIYYIYDYTMSVYTDFWHNNIRVVVEFLPLFFCFIYFSFCIVYYREYEQKREALHKEQIIRITSEQRAKEIETVKAKEQEMKLLRHDMRHFFTNLQLCISDGNTEKALEMISSFSEIIENTAIMRFCKNSTINYVISAFSEKFRENGIRFNCSIKIENLDVDEISFASIVSNALENAYNAQLDLPVSKRKIDLMLCNKDEKILFSIRNPYFLKPVFVDGIPVSRKEGHGFGTQSILYLTESLGGNCQFSVTDEDFIIRVVI